MATPLTPPHDHKEIDHIQSHMAKFKQTHNHMLSCILQK